MSAAVPPNVRLLIADLVGETVTRDSFRALQVDIDDLRARLDEAERASARLPHRQKYLLLNIAFVRRILDVHEELLDDIERDLDGTQRGAG